MQLVLMQFLSLDGVCQGPGAPDEDTTGGFDAGGWLVPHLDPAFVEIVAGWTALADAYLFGRRTYTAFARDWPAMDDPGDPVATSLNNRPKYVVSSTLTEASWDPTEIIAGDPAAAVAALRARPGRELQIHGSARLGASLLAAGLVDVLRLAIAPVVVGSGRRLFTGGSPAGLEPTGTTTTPAGVVMTTYAVGRAARTGTYDPAVHRYAADRPGAPGTPA